MKKLSLVDSENLASTALVAVIIGAVMTFAGALWIWGPIVLLSFGLLTLAIGAVAVALLYSRPEVRAALEEGGTDDGLARFSPGPPRPPRGTSAEFTKPFEWRGGDDAIPKA